MSTKPKRGRGRPAISGDKMRSPIPVRFPDAMHEQIEAIQAARLDAPDKSAVIRELVAEALQARARKK